MRPRSAIFWTLLAVFVAASLVWLFVVPYSPERLYKAIPAQATVVSAHHNVAGRWDDLRGNPIMLSFLHTFGVKPEEVQEVAADPAFRKWLDALASDEVVVAYVPSLGVTGDPCWVIASWIGGRSQRLRWLLRTQDGFEPAWRRVHAVWTLRPKGWHSDMRIRFTLAEGMAIACISADPAAIDEVLACHDGYAPSLFQRPQLTLPAAAGGALDRGWFRMAGQEGPYSASRGSYAFTELRTNRVQGLVRLPYKLAKPEAQGAPIGEVEEIWGRRPVGWISVDRSVALWWFARLWKFPWATAGAELLARDIEGPVALALFADPYSGRLKGLKLPTLMAAGAATNGPAAMSALRARLDVLNSRYRWGLVPRELAREPRPVYAIEGTGRSLYAALAPNEQIGYTAGSNWLMLASNVEGLTNVLADAARGASASRVMADGEPASLRGWFNLEDGGKALRVALTAYAFKLGMEDSRGSQATRQRLNEAKAWIDALAPLGELTFTVQPEGELSKIEFAAGRAQ
jgi:hypothetical protein